MSRKVEIRLLGPPRFTLLGRPLTFVAPPKALPLLAYLILNRGASLRRETVAYALWPDDPEPEARANLRRHLYRLSQALPKTSATHPWIITTGATINWNTEAPASIDFDDFQRAAASGRLEEAADLYGGDLLEGYDEPWLAPEREQLRSAYIKVLVTVCQGARAAGACEKTIDYAQRLLLIEPWREETLRWLIVARYELGDRAGALCDYETFARRLRDEFDAEPSDETASLQRLIQQGARLGASEPSSEDALPRRRPLPFVGRSSVAERFMQCWQDARAGTGITLLVGGAAGVGKSRLVNEVATRIESEGGRVLVGGTSSVETQPYQAVIEALRRALPLLLAENLGALWLGVLSIVLPDITVRSPSVRRPARLHRVGERRRLFDAVGQAIATLCRTRPLLLALEDIHWAGPDSMELLEGLARLAPTLPLVIAATYRDDSLREDVKRTLRRLENDEVAVAVPLGPFSRSDVRLLARRVFDDPLDLGERAARLFSISAGNALFLTEAIHAQEESASTDAMPPTLTAMIAGRIARLPNDARALAGTASVLGTGFDIEVLREICGWHESEVIDALDVLLDHAIVRAGTNRTRAAYAFTHELIRATMYEETPEPARRLAHRRAARALARVYADRRDDLAGELALHLDRAGMFEQAAREYLTAAQRANAVFANDDVVRLSTNGLALGPEPSVRFKLLALREETNSRRGNRAAAAEDLEALKNCAEELDDDLARCDVLVREVSAHHATGDVELAATAIVTLERVAARTGDTARVAVAKSCAATHVQLQGRTKEAIQALRVAMEAYRSIGDNGNMAVILGQIAEMFALSGDADGADTSIEQARSIAVDLRDRALLAQVLSAASRTCQHLRRHQELKNVASELLAIAREIGDAVSEAQALTSYGNACVTMFDFQSADEHYEQAAEIQRRCGNRLGTAVIASNRAVLYGKVADWERARLLSTEARATFADVGDLARELSATYNEAQACIETGDPELALELALHARELAAAHGGAPLESATIGLVGICERHLGRLSDSVAHLEESIELERQLPNAAEIQSALAELTLSYVESGDASSALRAVAELHVNDEGEGDWAGLTQPQLVPWAAYRAYALAGEDDKASLAVKRAHAIFEKLRASIPTERWRDMYGNSQLNRSIAEAANAVAV